MLTFDHVSITYGKKQVVRNACFTAEDGQITVLMGLNGCGKTSLLRAAMGSNAYGGHLLLDGDETAALRHGDRARRVALMMQTPPLPDMSTAQLVSYGRTPYLSFDGRMRDKDKGIVTEALKKTGLTELADTPVRLLSGGERQRAYFAMLLCQQTKNCLLDEPAASLDARAARRLFDMVRTCKREGCAVLAVLHQLEDAVAIGDKLVVMENSEISFCGNREEFLKSKLPQRVFGLVPIPVQAEDGSRMVVFRPIP